MNETSGFSLVHKHCVPVPEQRHTHKCQTPPTTYIHSHTKEMSFGGREETEASVISLFVRSTDAWMVVAWQMGVDGHQVKTYKHPVKALMTVGFIWVVLAVMRKPCHPLSLSTVQLLICFRYSLPLCCRTQGEQKTFKYGSWLHSRVIDLVIDEWRGSRRC